MKYLITGSNGLLGQKLVYALLQKNADITATAKGANRIFQQTGYTYRKLDITDADAVKTLFAELRPDVVINTAAMTNVDACETQKEECDQINISGVENIVQALQSLKSTSYEPHLLQLSTDFVFDGEAGPYKEEDTPNPLSYYALSKYRAEKIVRQSSLKWAIIRTIIIYGVVDNMSRSNIVLWAKDALSKGKTIQVVDDQFRSPTLAEDLAEGCILIAEKGVEGIYHISGRETMSILEMVYRIAGFYGFDKTLIKPVKSAELNQAAKRPSRTGFILDKAVRELNYQPHSFLEGLKTVDVQLKQKWQ